MRFKVIALIMAGMLSLQLHAEDKDHDDHASKPPVGVDGKPLEALANTNKVVFTNLAQKASYVIGVMNAANIMMDAEDLIVPEMVVMGMRDVFYRYQPLVSYQEAEEIQKEFNRAVTKHQEENAVRKAETNRVRGVEFLAENKKKEGVITTESGLQYKVLSAAGKGESPKAEDRVAIHFRTKTIDGIEFSSSHKHKAAPITALKALPKGLQEALLKMKQGDKWELYVPSELAYGSREVGKDVGPHSTLIFELELVSIEPNAEVKN